MSVCLLNTQGVCQGQGSVIHTMYEALYMYTDSTCMGKGLIHKLLVTRTSKTYKYTAGTGIQVYRCRYIGIQVQVQVQAGLAVKSGSGLNRGLNLV